VAGDALGTWWKHCQKIVTGIVGLLGVAIGWLFPEAFIPLEDSVSVDPALRTGRGLGRWIGVGEWLVFALLVARFFAHGAPQAWNALNNDFPDYFVTASLLHEHYDTSRVYEWIWLQRQMDHRGIEAPLVNLAPSTTFSTLALYPFTRMPILAAKHGWILLNIGLLLATLWLLRDLTQLPWRRLALVAALSFPLRINLLNGQYYVLLLFLLTLACALYLRQRRFVAGVIVGVAAGMKIFPVIFLLYFLRKRDLRAFAGGVAGGVASAVVSVLAFGWEANRIYLLQVLPATLRGEANEPYALKLASLPVLLHRLFVYEPQLNPHPAVHAAWLVAVLHPLLQMMVIAPALLLAAPKESRGVTLEWSALLLASLAVSTSPGGYLFTLLIFPACVVLGKLQGRKSYLAFATVLVLYFAAGYLGGANHSGDGWRALLGVPRLYALLLCCVLLYAFLMRQSHAGASKRGSLAWAAALGVVVVLSIAANLRHQRGVYDDYRSRTGGVDSVYIAADPAVEKDAVLYVGMTGDGYRFAVQKGGVTQVGGDGGTDVLGVAAGQGHRWMEQAAHESTIVLRGDAGGVADGGAIAQAEHPVVSFDGRWLGYLREDHGRARVWLRALGQAGSADRAVTPPELNVMEMTFLPTGELVFAAASDGRPGLFATDRIGSEAVTIRSLGLEGARYPAVSPDGRWLAYARMQGGSWNLWLRDWTSGETRRLTDADCNTTGPAWAADSKTLVYASDCGRALSFSALSMRRVVP